MKRYFVIVVRFRIHSFDPASNDLHEMDERWLRQIGRPDPAISAMIGSEGVQISILLETTYLPAIAVTAEAVEDVLLVAIRQIALQKLFYNGDVVFCDSGAISHCRHLSDSLVIDQAAMMAMHMPGSFIRKHASDAVYAYATRKHNGLS